MLKIQAIGTALAGTNEKVTFLTSAEEIILIKALYVIKKEVEKKSGKYWKKVTELTSEVTPMLQNYKESFKTCSKDMADAFIALDSGNTNQGGNKFDVVNILLKGEIIFYISEP